MNILTVDNITKSYGVRKIFDGASFFLQEGEKAGIIGINGTGKSTLLKMIAGLEEADDGTVIKANHCLVRYLPQNPEFAPEETVLEAVLRGNRVEENAGTIEADAKSMLTKLGVTEFDQPCGQLSGGQRKRLALVSVLLSPAEILLLDEPTNHLDNSMSDWLEDQLRRRKGAMIMVTHDRYFLDSVTDRILELDKGKIYSYDANYSGYLELKMQREEMAQASEKKRLNILRNELAWVQRGARARSTKQKARLQRFEELKNVKGPVTDGKVELTSAASRLGRTTVEIENVSKSYGDKVLIRDFTYLFGKDDRVGFIGPNGSGKTTLMKMILCEVAPDSGHIEIGQTVKLGYYAQEIDDTMMHPEQRVIDYIRDVAEYITTEDGQITAARMLERFLFSGEDQYGQLGKLSGGERRRLQLCKVLMGAPNVLILDEPTTSLNNDEVEHLFQIIRRLKEKGTAFVFISHKMPEIFRIADRYTVLRNGEFIKSGKLSEITQEEVTGLMVGEKFSHQEIYQKRELGENVLELNGLSGHGFSNVNLTVKKGSIVGLTGLQGSGSSELLQGLFGAVPVTGGTLKVSGKECRIHGIQGAMKAGIAMLASNRKENSVIPDMSILENMYLSEQVLSARQPLISAGRERERYEKYKKLLSIKAADPKGPITSLSGGNQQKVFLARWLNTEAGILLLDNPTQGIDVGAKAEIYKLILKLAGAGKTILINTLEIPELAKVADCCAVFYEGTIIKMLQHEEIDEKTVMLYSTNAAQKGES